MPQAVGRDGKDHIYPLFIDLPEQDVFKARDSRTGVAAMLTLEV